MLALFLIAAISVGVDSWILSRSMYRIENNAVKLNLAGRQRALNLQIGELSNALVFADNARLRGELRARLQVVVDEQERGHERLLGEFGMLPDELEALYLSEPVSVHRRLHDILHHARSLLAAPDAELTPGNTDYQYILANNGDMLISLDKVASAYQREGEQSIYRLEQLTLWINGSVLLVLTLSGLFILLPMERRIVADRRRLEGANSKLDAVLLKELRQRQRLSTLYQLAAQMLWLRSRDEAMQNTADFLSRTLPVTSVAVFNYEPDERQLVLRAVQGMNRALVGGARMSAVEGSKGAAMLFSRSVTYAEDIHANGWLDELGNCLPASVTQGVAVAIEGQEQRFGIIVVLSGPESILSADDLEYIQSLGDLLGIACDGIQSDYDLHRLQQDLLRGTRISALGELGTSLAHELNQPLVAIMSYGYACRRTLEAGADGSQSVNGQSTRLSEIIGKLVGEAERAGEIIKNMRDYLENGPLHETALDINRLIRNSVDMALPESITAGVTIHSSLDQELPPASFDKIQLQQVMFNLLRNALHHSEDAKERKISVTTSGYNERMIEVVVADSGSGEYDFNFESNSYTPFAHRENPMGMGLSVCKSIVDAHGGKIWAVKEPPGSVTSSSVHFTLFTERR